MTNEDQSQDDIPPAAAGSTKAKSLSLAAERQRLKLDAWNSIARWLAAFVMLGVVVWVIVGPDRAYAPSARTLVFLLAGVTLALMTGAEVANKLEFKGPGIAITLVSSAAVALGTVWLLQYLTKPESEVVAIDILTEDKGRAVIRAEMVELRPGSGAQATTYAVNQNTIFVIYPSDVAFMDIALTYPGSNPFTGRVPRPTNGRVTLLQSKQEGGKHTLTPAG